MVGLIELIKLIGEDNVKVQGVNNSIVKIQDKKRTNDTEVTIATNEINANDIAVGSGRVGLIVWISRADHDKYLK